MSKRVKQTTGALIVIAVILLVVFGLLFRQSVSGLSKDPSVTSLTNEGIFRVVQIINMNKNQWSDRLEECWNTKNPNLECSEANALTEGKYSLAGGQDAKWLDGPKEDGFELSDDFIRDALGGFKNAEQQYEQVITISYTDQVGGPTGSEAGPGLMKVEVETKNSDNDTSYRLINLNAK